MTYVMMLWVTLASGPTFAKHEFNSLAMCESFKQWFIKDQKMHDAKAVCVLKQDYAI